MESTKNWLAYNLTIDLNRAMDRNNWLRKIRNYRKAKEWWPVLQAKLRGHYQYYGVSGNMRSLRQFYNLTERMTLKWLNRRSQCKSFSWAGFRRYREHYPLPQPRIVHNFYTLSPVGWVLLKSRMREIFTSGSARGVEALSYGRILWHSSIERGEKQGIQSMPTWESHITSTWLSWSHKFAPNL